MANLFTKKPQLKHIELSIGDAYLKPLPMTLLSHASKLADQDVSAEQQAVSFSMILKAVLVDANGNEFDDLKDLTPDQVATAFSLEDFTAILTAIMPDGAEEGNAS